MASDPRVFFHSRLPKADVQTFLTDTFEPDELEAITDYEVVVLTSADWTPQVEGTDLAITCVQCENEVNDDGETLRLDGELYHLCCPSC
ncbi:hypothetical protein [Haladaptatus halobius]|uniref:hypothetical protein n=1 Tax=Haladaptatus halobius TaxID=2884875 RepID=UPI001D0BB658|nr:hypothetical protein [Haladaptatus halobius]